MYEKLSISDDQLRSCLQEQYGLTLITLEFLPLGLDSRAGVYRLVSMDGIAYLLKVRSGSLYEPGCLVARYLSDQGIHSVVAPVLTRSRALWTQVEDWTVCLYPFIDGDTNWTGMTDEHWQQVGAIFKRVHQITLPFDGFKSLRKETLDPTQYASQVRDIECQYIDKYRDSSISAQALSTSWMTHQSTIHTVVAALEKLAPMLQRQAGPFVLCHADLHPANLLRNQAGQVFVIDWDEVMLAPKERDFIYAITDQTQPSSSPFFHGYGQVEIDWIALTYYRWERIIQDLIVCAQNVLLRDDLGAEAKSESVSLFDTILVGKHDIQVAYATATRIFFVHGTDGKYPL